MKTDSAPSPNRFEALDGWRGVCACFVVLFHFHGHSPLYSVALVRNSYLFVDFFFVLSGFVIAWNYGRRLGDAAGVKRFLILRLGRVYPLHLFMLLCFVGYETLRLMANSDAFTGPNSPQAVVTNLLLVQSMGVHDSLTWNGPSWSISTEWWTYALFAVVALWLGVRSGLVIAAAAILPIALLMLSRTGMDTTFDWGFLRCVFGFALGVACCQIYSLGAGLGANKAAHRRNTAVWATALEVAVVIAVVLFVSAAGTSPLSFMAPFIFGAAVLVFAAERGWVSRLFHSRALKWLGMVSYSIYLTHFFIVLILPAVLKRVTHIDLWTAMALPNGQWLMAYGRNDAQGTLLYLVALGLTLAFSAFTYRWVETPGREWTRRWLARPRPAPQAHAVQS